MNKETILNVLFPRHCPVCGEIVKPLGGLICPACFHKLSFVKQPVCKKCGKEIQDAAEEFCGDCTKRRHAFESGLALMNYDETARRSMAWIKYKNKREYLDFYGAALAARYEKQIRRIHADVLVPVPVHPSRKRARGFNQAEVLAICLGKRLGIPVGSGMLIRDKKTKPQKELSAADRLKNLSGAFRAGTIPGPESGPGALTRQRCWPSAWESAWGSRWNPACLSGIKKQSRRRSFLRRIV